MKRLSAILLACILTLGLCSCANNATPAATTLSSTSPTETVEGPKFSVPSPMAVPKYTLDPSATTDQLRQTAVQAMRDLLSIQWCTDIEIAYRKTGSVSQKHFKHLPNKTYAGTIYSNAATGLFQFMEYYEQERGLFSFSEPVDVMKEKVGNSCADSLLWGWSSVCNSITGGFYYNAMVYSNGYLPVGGYTYNTDISSYMQCPTNTIIEKNGTEKILECYTQVQMGDALVSSTDKHAIMAIKDAHVAYKADGTIDTTSSYILIQDQRGGNGEGFYEQIKDGETIRYSGRTSYSYTFKILLEKNYIPVTTAEFQGEKAYDQATLDVSNEACGNINELQQITLSSNYPLAVIRLVATDETGTRTVLDRVLFSGANDNGVPRTYALADMESVMNLASNEQCKPGTTISIDVIVSTGDTFTPIEFPIA